MCWDHIACSKIFYLYHEGIALFFINYSTVFKIRSIAMWEERITMLNLSMYSFAFFNFNYGIWIILKILKNHWPPHLILLCMSQIQNHFRIYLISYLIMSCIKTYLTNLWSEEKMHWQVIDNLITVVTYPTDMYIE